MRRSSDQSGFTLIELMVVVSILGVMTAIAGSGLASWASTNTHRSVRAEVVSALRRTAERALSEGRTYCMAFGTDGSWTSYRSACGPTGVVVGANQGVAESGSTIAPSFTYNTGLQSACPVAAACAYFYPRGTASAGTVQISRNGKPTYTVVVEQLTSRVYVD